MDNGIHHWNDRGGLVGRGVLLDYVRYAEKRGIEYEVMSRHQITLEDLEAMAEDEGVTFQPGDILVVRSGFTKWYESAGEDDRKAKIQGAREDIKWTGVEGSERVIAWLWNHHFAAVAGDSISFEVRLPATERGAGG